MKKLVFVFLTLISFSIFAGTIDQNSRGIMAIGDDGKIYWSEKGADFKPFAPMPVKAIAIGVTEKSAFAVGEDGGVYLYKDAEKKFVPFGKLPGKIKAVDITPYQDDNTKRLFVLGEDDMLYMPDGQGSFKVFKELPGGSDDEVQKNDFNF